MAFLKRLRIAKGDSGLYLNMCDNANPRPGKEPNVTRLFGTTGIVD